MHRGKILLIEDDPSTEYKVDGKKANLWPKEFELLWGHEYQGNSRTIEITVQRLRKKLGKKGKLIETVKSYGYKLAN